MSPTDLPADRLTVYILFVDLIHQGIHLVGGGGMLSGGALGALIGAYQEDDSGGLRALLPLAGRTLLEYQVRCASAAGAAPVVVVVERVPQAKSLPDPQLGLGFVLDQVERDGEYMGERYALSQMFPWFGTLQLKGDIATQEAEAAARRYEAERLALVEEVTAAWFEYAWLHEAVATTRHSAARRRRTSSRVRMRADRRGSSRAW